MNRLICTADCETDPFKAGRFPKPFIWGFYTGKVYKEFNTTQEFVDHVKEIDCIVYAHNGGKFDWHFILDQLEAFSPISVINGRLSKFTIGKAEFRDSYNILPVPLSAYKKDEFNYELLEPEVRHLHMPEIKKYLKADCVYLYEIVSRFVDEYGLSLTLAGAALKSWEKISEEKAPKTTPDFYNRFKPYYYGGRVEVFELGEIHKDFKVIDINSAYPDAMMNYHPWGDTYLISKELPETNEEIKRAFITVKAVSRGAFPYRDEKGALRFPNDKTIREYTVTGHEYLAGIETGTVQILEVIEVLTFPEFISFREYVTHYYKMKEETDKELDPAGYLIAKLFLNTLYGKFAANPEEYKSFLFVEKWHMLAAEREGYDYVAEVDKWLLVARDLFESEQRYYNVATAASVTGSVRAKLWRAICQTEGIMYCDTDSIACESVGNLELDAKKLGAWDVEAECDYAAISGKKLYAFRKKDGSWKKASKGARLDEKELVQLAKGKTVTYANPAPTYSIKRKPTFITRNLVITK